MPSPEETKWSQDLLMKYIELSDSSLHLILLDKDTYDEFNRALQIMFFQTKAWMDKVDGK